MWDDAFNMKRNIVFISGFGGAGKTTCGQMLYSRLKSVAYVEADWFFQAKPLPATGNTIYRLKLYGVEAAIRNYHREGFQTIIVVGYVWSQKELNAIMLRLKDLDTKISFSLFWLDAPKATRHDRVLSRPGETVTQKWLDGVERKIKNPWPLHHKLVRCEKIEVADKHADMIVDDMLGAITL